MKISLEGLPGTKKNIIFQKLAETGYQIKNSDDPEWHQLFLSDSKQFALSYELNRLINFHYLYENDSSQLYDSLYALKKVYVEHLHDLNIIDKYSYDLFMKFYRLLYIKPDIIIYFYGPFDTSFKMAQESAKNRGEYIYTEKEFRQLYYKYECVFDNNNCTIPIYKVNIDDDLDLIVSSVLDIIKRSSEH